MPQPLAVQPQAEEYRRYGDQNPNHNNQVRALVVVGKSWVDQRRRGRA